MKNEKRDIVKSAFVDALGTVLYIVILVSAVSFFSPFMEGKETILLPMLGLTLFVFSAALTGSLVLGKPIILFSEGKKHEAISLFFYTLTFLFAALIILLLLSFIF